MSHFPPFVNFEAIFDTKFDTGTKIFVKMCLMEFNDVFKIGLRAKIRQRVPDIYHFSQRKLEILNVSKF